MVTRKATIMTASRALGPMKQGLRLILQKSDYYIRNNITMKRYKVK